MLTGPWEHLTVAPQQRLSDRFPILSRGRPMKTRARFRRAVAGGAALALSLALAACGGGSSMRRFERVPRTRLRRRREPGGEAARRDVQQDLRREGGPGHRPRRRLPAEAPDGHQHPAGAGRVLQLGRRQHPAVRGGGSAAAAGRHDQEGSGAEGELPAVGLRNRAGRREVVRRADARHPAGAAVPQQEGARRHAASSRPAPGTTCWRR